MAVATKAGEKLQASLLLKDERASRLVVEPTVMAVATKAGEKLQASLLLLPAATTTTTPASVAAPIEAVYDGSAPLPPRLMLMTAGRSPFAVTQSIATICQERAPDPWSDKVLTACKFAVLATPNVSPPAVPAQCVPWPWRSKAQEVSEPHTCRDPEVISMAGTARPPKSLCE